MLLRSYCGAPCVNSKSEVFAVDSGMDKKNWGTGQKRSVAAAAWLALIHSTHAIDYLGRFGAMASCPRQQKVY